MKQDQLSTCTEGYLAEAVVQFDNGEEGEKTPLRIEHLPRNLQFSNVEEEYLWLLARGYSAAGIQNHLRLTHKEMVHLCICIEAKLGTERLAEAAALLEAAGYNFNEYDRSDLAEKELSVLVGARVLFPLHQNGFAGLRLCQADGQRLNLWITSTNDREVPGWAFIERPDDPGAVWLSDINELRNAIQIAGSAQAIKPLRAILASIAEEAIDWLDRLDGDLDEDDGSDLEDGWNDEDGGDDEEEPDEEEEADDEEIDEVSTTSDPS